MIWYMSALLSLVLFLGIVAVYFPDLVIPFIAKRWKQSWYYWKSELWQWPSLPAWFNHNGDK